MVNPGFLQQPSVISWLDGLEPAWVHINFDSYCRLNRRPEEEERAMRLATDLTADEARLAPFIAHTMTFLRLAEARDGIPLTATGNLARAVVAELADHCAWPAFDLDLLRQTSKVLDAADVWPLQLLESVAVSAGFLRRKHRKLVLTKKGLAALKSGGAGDLTARLFEIVFWQLNRAYWDGYPVPTWPQYQTGLIAWSLSVVAGTWQPPRRLARLATVPVIGVLEAKDDFSGQALELRVLRFLAFFGLLEARRQSGCTERLLAKREYRKSPFFDRFLSFDVTLEPRNAPVH